MNPAAKGRVLIATILLGAILLFLIAAEIVYGPVEIPFNDCLSILTGHAPERNGWDIILFESRLPRTFTSLFAGSALAISGLLMQTLFRNPLAGPSVLGVTSGASLAVALTVMAGGTVIGQYGIVASAMAGSLAVLMLILLAAERLKDSVVLLIFGIMLGHFAGAIESVLQQNASKESLRDFVIWGLGTFSSADSSQMFILMIATIVVALFLLLLLPSLNVILLGEEYAKSMGVNVKKVRWFIIIATGVLTGICTAFCGPVAFIGLVVPHIARMLLGRFDHRLLFPMVILLGGITGLLSDLLTRLMEVPLNAVTSALGAPIVIYILFKGSKTRALI